MPEKIRWGLVGLGKISDTFARDLALVPDAELTAVGSRNLDKARAFQNEHSSRYSFGSYEELFQCPEVDVVYIGTPHTFHAELAIQAMQHGKHVLCEKPMGVTGDQTTRMINVAREQQVFLMEALWSRFIPAIATAYDLIQSGTIGSIRYQHADFAFYALDREEEGRLLNPALAGGSLLDIGIYPIFLSYLLLGVPEGIQCISQFHKTGAEIQTAMVFEYTEAQALLFSGLTCNSEMKAEIAGTKGSIHLHPRWHESPGYTLELNGEIETVTVPKQGKGYVHEIQHVHHCLRNGKTQSPLWSHQDSQELVNLMDKVRLESGIRFPFE
ncbi:MAG: Gfo/Idh/MocA family oxidoreductase [Eudoraea sp.]|nr:Gfo/Idh/MocA family oxidoreductase [Eudoraea sp.]NNJ39327.1 Gfo/Idh/MocA family oxidoreductase [Eudoraea sp.]